MVKEPTMIGLSDSLTQVIRIGLSDAHSSDALSEFFMGPRFDLDALMSQEDQKWLRVLMQVRDAVRN